MKIDSAGITNFLLLFMMGPFLLITQFSYTNITITKYVVVVTCCSIMIIFWILYFGIYKGRIIDQIKNNVLIMIFLAGFMGSIIGSTILAEFKKTAWIGEKGRYTGALVMLLLCMIIVVLLTIYEFRPLILDWFIGFGNICAVWGMLNAFGVDFWNMHQGYPYWLAVQYVSGIGHRTFYAMVLVLVTAICMVLYIYEDSRKKYYYGISLLIFFSAGILSASDNYLLALFFELIILPTWILKDVRRLKRGMDVLVMLLVVAWFLNCAIPFTGIYSEQFDFASRLLVRSVVSRVALIAVLLARMAIGYCVKKGWEIGNIFPKYTFVVLTVGIVVVALILMGYMTFLVPALEGKEKDSYLAYFQLNDSWGSNRGFVWRLCWESFCKMPLLNKLFGNGADLTGYVLFDYFGEYSYSVGGYWDNAHNEYLQ